MLICLFSIIFVSGVLAQNYAEIKTSQMPKKITEYLKKNLGTYTLGRVAKYDEKGLVRYAVVAELRGNKSIYVFDKDGNYLTREKSLKDLKQSKALYPSSTPVKKDDKKTSTIKK